MVIHFPFQPFHYFYCPFLSCHYIKCKFAVKLVRTKLKALHWPHFPRSRRGPAAAAHSIRFLQFASVRIVFVLFSLKETLQII